MVWPCRQVGSTLPGVVSELLPVAVLNATFCATVVDEWLRCGLTDAVIAPGSRSTPLTLALAARSELRTHVVLDERSAGFVALGLGLASGRPALVVTTSGTAAAELHAAVAEANAAGVPLLVCTADRPPELHGVGAPQTIDQTRLFGTAARWFAEPGPPSAEAAGSWRSLAARAWLEATGSRPGPVHLNLAFREPLVGVPGALPPGRVHGRPWHTRLPVDAVLPAATAAELARRWAGADGVLVAGAGVDDVDAVLELGARLGWPVLADPRSGCRVVHPAAVAHADALLRIPAVADALRPSFVVRLGQPPASKVLSTWLAASGAESLLVEEGGAWLDPGHDAAAVVAVPVGAFAHGVTEALVAAALPAAPSPVLARWRALDDTAAGALSGAVADEPAVSEVAVARGVVARAGADAALFVSSSMPVRDVEWFAARAVGPRVLANRGANGIDGVVSTAVGVALSGLPTWLLIGDLALLHDVNGLLGVSSRSVRLRLVVVDNAGGGIFSFLPQARTPGGQVFERFFGTAQDVDVLDVLRSHAIPTAVAATPAELDAGLAGLATATDAVAALVVRTDRAANVVHHDRLHQAVARAVAALSESSGPLVSPGHGLT